MALKGRAEAYKEKRFYVVDRSGVQEEKGPATGPKYPSFFSRSSHNGKGLLAPETGAPKF